METTGVLIADPICTVINTQKGPSNKWGFVLNVPGKFETKVAFIAFGDKGDVLADCAAGNELTVKANPESREYNGKWYTDLKAWSIKVTGSGASTGASNAQVAQPAPAPRPAPAPVPEPMESQDLPF